MAAARETGNSTRGRRVVRRQARRGARSSSRAALATAATLVVLLAAAAARADWDPVPPEAWQEPARPDSGGGDAIMLLDHADYRQESEKFHVDYFARARVFTAEGRDIGNVEIEFLKDRWKLTNVRGRCVTPGGKTTELDPAQILYTTSLSAKDLVVTKASATIPGIEPGCIVEWGYTLEGPSEEYNPWAFRFANRYYTCVSTHTWHPSSQDEAVVRKDWQYYGIQPVFVEETCLPNRERPREVTFTTRRQPGVRDEEMAPPAEDATPRVVVYYAPATITATGYWSGWKRMIDAYQDEMGKKSDALDGVLTAIREGHPEPEAALEATFHWVQGHLHSNAELPVERQPDAAKIRKSYRFAEDLGQLLGKSEADPLEINTLMALAAQRLGFTAYVALVGDRRFETFDHRVVGFPPFNAITAVMVGGRKIFLQPDSRFETFGSVPWYLRGGYGLLSGNGHDLFFFVPPDAGAGATSLWDLQVNLSDDGGMEGRVEARLAGEAARGWRRGLWDEPAADRTEYLRKRLAENEGPKADLEVPSLDTPPDSDLVLRGTARWPGVASATGDRIVVPIDRVIPWRTHGQFAPPRRKQNLLFRDHGVETFRVRFHLPAGMTADHLPDPQEFRNELGAWSERWTRDGADVVLERRLELALAEVPPQGYALVRDLFRSLQAADQTVLLVTRSR